MCSYWDQQLDGGYGSWSQEGCTLILESSDTVVCQCNNLGSYALIVDTTAGSDTSIGLYTIIGAAILLMCVIFVLLSLLITP